MTVSTPALSPGVHVTWRPPGTLSIELADGSIVRCEPVPAALARATRLLDGTRSVSTAASLTDVDPRWIDWLFAVVPAVGASSVARATTLVEVRGCGDLGSDTARHLVDAGMRVALHDPGDPSSPTAPPGWTRADELRDEMLSAGTPAERVLVSQRSRQSPDVCVLTPAFAECDRAETDALMRADRPHIITGFVAATAAVGPFVVPGVTACLRCGDLAAAQIDESWPTRLAERITRRVNMPTHLRAWAASTVTHQVLAWTNHHSPDALGTALELNMLDGRLRSRRWLPHPDCGCLCP